MLRGERKHVERIGRAFGDDHFVAERVQLQRCDLAHRVVVVDDQNRLLSAFGALPTDGSVAVSVPPHRPRAGGR